MSKENEDKLRHLFSGTGEKAGDNLRYRIMRQIETESALVRKKAKDPGALSTTIFPVLGVMYTIVGAIVLAVYMTYGSEALLSTPVFLPIIFVTSVCSVYLLISAFDERRRKHTKK